MKILTGNLKVSLLLDKVSVSSIADGLNKLLADDAYYQQLQQECLKARAVYCWQEEEKRLLSVYKNVFSGK